MPSIFDIPTSFISREFFESDVLPDYRTQFMRDRDRVMYCTAFRRLAGKTQIYTIGSDDHRKNRLTHSLEVSQIARTIAYALNLNVDLTEAIALSHDFGHTPFGHAGERMLHDIMIPESDYIKNSPYYKQTTKEIKDTIQREANAINTFNADNMFGFKHNLQSVCIACALEDSYRNESGKNIGLNLTNYTLWGMMHHSKTKYDDKDGFPNYQTRFESLLRINETEAEAWSFEAYIVSIADDIAQWHHDLEDAIRGDAIPIKSICNTIEAALSEKLLEQDKAGINDIKSATRVDRKCIAELSHIVVNTLVNDIVDTSKENLKLVKDNLETICEKEMITDDVEKAKKLYSSYDSLDIRLPSNNEQLSRDEVIALSSKIQKMEFQKTIRKWVHHSRDVERMNEKGKYIIRKLFEAYYTHPQQLPDGPIFHFMVDVGKYENIDDARKTGAGQVRTEFEDELNNPPIIKKAILMRKICDHIASMTDHYAIEEYNNLYG